MREDYVTTGFDESLAALRGQADVLDEFYHISCPSTHLTYSSLDYRLVSSCLSSRPLFIPEASNSSPTTQLQILLALWGTSLLLKQK